MIVNKALTAAALLLFTSPMVPALAHDGYGDRGYVRCLACPGSWRDHDGWRDRYRWRDYDRWRDHYRWRDHDGWRRHYGGWPYGGWRYGGWEY